MRWLTRAVTIAIVVALAGAAVAWLAHQARGPEVGGSFRTSAAFRDASRLPVGSRVMISGVPVGTITRLAIEGRLARVEMRLADDVVLWSNAWAEKRAESLFGDGYVELHPGEPGPGVRRLASGEPIPRIVDEVSTDRSLRDLDRALPRARSTLHAAERLLREARRALAGQLQPKIEAADQALRAPDPLGLAAANDALARLEAGTAEIAAALDPARVDRALDDFAADVDGVAADLRAGRAAVEERLGAARAALDEIDPYLEDAADVLAAAAGDGPREDRGTLARLVDDPALADTLEDVSEAGVEAAGSLSRLETFIGLRTEFNLLSAQPRFYVTAEISGRLDSFYLFEIEKGGLGDIPDVRLEDRPGDPGFLRRAEIFERLRFTAQWGRRFDRTSVRFGLKEGTFGVGADARILRGRLKLSADVFGASFSRVPRVKVTAALRVFESIYLLAGVDDALADGGYLPILPWPDGVDEPVQFEEVRYGRDAFLGAMLRFDDEDLEELLMIYGAAVFGLL